MNLTTRLGAVCVAISFLAGCAGASDNAEDQPADTAAMAMPAATDASGTWNMSAVPETGEQTPTDFQFQVANGSWTMLLKDRDPIVPVVIEDGDSIIIDAGPYKSVRRDDMMVSTHSVVRINGDQMTGTTRAHYQTAGADSVLVLRTQGTRVR